MSEPQFLYIFPPLLGIIYRCNLVPYGYLESSVEYTRISPPDTMRNKYHIIIHIFSRIFAPCSYLKSTARKRKSLDMRILNDDRIRLPAGFSDVRQRQGVSRGRDRLTG